MSLILSGWRDCGTVGETLLGHAEFVAGCPWLLVTSIDSNPEVTSLDWARGIGRDVEGALLVPGAVLIDLIADDDILVGFDEIWVCEGPPPRRPDASYFLVAPRRLDDPIERVRFEWISGSAFLAGVGDGFGMNYISRERDILSRLGLSVTDEEL